MECCDCIVTQIYLFGGGGGGGGGGGSRGGGVKCVISMCGYRSAFVQLLTEEKATFVVQKQITLLELQQ